MNYFTQASAALAALLYVVLIHRVFRSHLPAYLILFFNLLLLLLTGVVDFTLYFGKGSVGFSEADRMVYFTNDLLRQAMVYILVISLILQAVKGSQRYRWVGRWLVLGAALLALLFFWFHHDDNRSLWLTNVIRNLSLIAMLMNLLLWILLVQKRTADRVLLMVTTGLGLQMAGEAIGQSLRLMNEATTTFGNVVLILAHLACLVVWYLAFRPRAQKPHAYSGT